MTKTVDVVAPVEQEGTKALVKSWYISAGDAIAEGEPLVELETDKVAVEVPAPISGTLLEIVVDADSEAVPGAILGKMVQTDMASPTNLSDAPAPPQDTQSQSSASAAAPSMSTGALHEHRLSPSVRRLVQEHELNPASIQGTGKGGRLTRNDVAEFLEQGGGATPAIPSKAGAFSLSEMGEPVNADIGNAQRIPHDSMRRRIAEHMSNSVHTAPHVTSVFEADFSAIMAHRSIQKVNYTKRGVKLTYTAYVVAAAVAAMKVAPAVNSRWHKDFLDIYDDVNIGVGVALGDKGLIVPVVHQAQTKSLFAVASDLHILTEKARDGKLSPADVRAGTFSISNHGTSGSLVASPIIINQPQSAILGVGKLEKRVIVKTINGVDSIQIRPMAFVSLTIDHRVLDGSQTNAWLTKFVDVIENWS